MDFYKIISSLNLGEMRLNKTSSILRIRNNTFAFLKIYCCKMTKTNIPNCTLCYLLQRLATVLGIRNHFSVLFSFMTYHRVYNESNTTGATSGAGTAYPSGAHEFTLGLLWGSCYSIFSFMCNVL